MVTTKAKFGPASMAPHPGLNGGQKSGTYLKRAWPTDGSPDVARDRLPWDDSAGDGDGDGDGGDGHPRFRGAPTARGPAEHLASSLVGGGPETEHLDAPTATTFFAFSGVRRVDVFVTAKKTSESSKS